MSTAIIKKVDENVIIEIEQACQDCSLATLQKLSPIRRTLALANGMQTIRKHLTGPLMADIMALANTPLGFLTDRKPGQKDKEGKEIKPYTESTIRDAVIEAMLRGASIIGNEFNVIAGSCYLTKQYFERMLREWPGLTELRVTEGVPTTSMSAGGALVPMLATWKLNGQADQLVCDHTSDGDYRIAVRVNSGMGTDAILGKAKRKAFARIFARITGSQWVAEQADMDAPYTIDVEAAETAAESPQHGEPHNEPSASEEIFRGIEAVLGTMDQISDVDAYQANAAALLEEEDDKAKLNEWCEWRRASIRESRGQKSNGKG